MTRKQAEAEAQAIARRDEVAMVVTFDPYSEQPDEAQAFGYFPAGAERIFMHEQVVSRIDDAGNLTREGEKA